MTSSHCWWFASSFHTGVPALHLMLRAVDFAQAVLGWNLDAAWSLLSAATSDHQIRILVTALSCHYPHGLLIAHNPSKGAFLFLPQSAPFFVSYATALKWAKVFPATPCMLFTQEAHSDVGHYEPCHANLASGVPPPLVDLSVAQGSLPPLLGRGFVREGGCHASASSCQQEPPPPVPPPQASSPVTTPPVPAAHHISLTPTHPFQIVTMPEPGIERVEQPSRKTFCSLPRLCSDPDCVVCSDELPVAPTQLDTSSESEGPSADLVDAVVREATPPAKRSKRSDEQSGRQHAQNLPCSDPSSLDFGARGLSCSRDEDLIKPCSACEAAVEDPVEDFGLRRSNENVDDDPIEDFSSSPASAHIAGAADNAGQVDLYHDGCSCVGLYAYCICGFLRRQPQQRHLPSMVGASSTEELGRVNTSSAQSLESAPANYNNQAPQRPPPQTPPATLPNDMYHTLLSLGVPPLIARDAASRHPDCVNAALDWACSSDRRHQRQHIDGVIDVERAEEECGLPMPIPPAPASWTRLLPAGTLHLHLQDLEDPQEQPDTSDQPSIQTGQVSNTSNQLQRLEQPQSLSTFQQHMNARTLASAIQAAASAFWLGRHDAVEAESGRLYEAHCNIAPRNVAALTDLFLDLPVAWPVQPADYNLTFESLHAWEVELFQQRAVDSHTYGGTIADAWHQPLALPKLLPFFAAVLCRFAEHAGIGRDFVFGFLMSFAPWVVHRDVHAIFNPLKPEHECRPRIFSTLIAESNTGKSPFFRLCLDGVFVSTPGKQCLTDRLQSQFAAAGPGKDKTLFVQNSTNSDFARRMKASDGHIAWLSEEAWSAVDVAWAKGKGKTQPTPMKINQAYLQNTQNGQAYGPLSINAEQFYIPTTNFTYFHAAQPKLVHDYWGQSFFADCPFNGMGWEFRPTFLFPGKILDEAENSPHVTFQGATAFMLDLFATLAGLMGHTMGSRAFHTCPLELTSEAAILWKTFHRVAEQAKDNVPDFAAGVVGKHCFTTTSHITTSHLLHKAFEHCTANRAHLPLLRAGDPDYLAALAQQPLDFLRQIAPQHILAGPEHIHFMLRNMVTLHNEMRLPLHERAGPQTLDDRGSRPARQPRACARSQAGQLNPMSDDDKALAILLQKCQHQQYITVTQANTAIPARFGFRSNRDGLERLFDLAARYGAGQREGSAQQSLRLRLHLSSMPESNRRHLNLPLLTVPPAMTGSGKTFKRPAAHIPPEQPKPKSHKAQPPQEQQAAPEQAHAAPARAEEAKADKREELGPPLILDGLPLSAFDVASRINASLEQRNDTLRVKATALKRKKLKQLLPFSLRCATCKHNTCTWSGIAEMDATCRSLSYFAYTGKQHGQPKPPVKAGRKSSGSRPALSETQVVTHSGPSDQASFMAAVSKHFQAQPLNQSLTIQCHKRKPTKKGLTCCFTCKTHCDEKKGRKDCPWSGMATLNTQADPPQILIRTSPSSAHAPDEKRLWGTLTHRQRTLVSSTSHQARLRTIDGLLANMRPRKAGDTKPKKPNLRQLQGFLQRFRQKTKAQSKEIPHSNKQTYSAADFEYLRDRLNADMGRATAISPTDSRLRPSDRQLRCIDLHLSEDMVCAPLICPQLLHLTLDLLPKPWNLKFSADGTNRLLFGQYTLLTLGVNVKNWSQRKSNHHFAYRSSFRPLAFALANTEDGDAYKHLLATLLRTANTLGHDLQPQHITQFHGDMHKGLEKARQDILPNSQRLADWAHVTGATSQGPSGLHGLLSKSLGDDEHITSMILQWCRLSKRMTAMLFHVVWSALFDYLGHLGHARLVVSLQHQYFHQTACPQRLWSAPWRSGPDRIMPGTDVGSAPQESWHGNVLKPSFPTTKYEPIEIANKLQAFIVEPALLDLEEMAQEGKALQDWPSIGQFIDQHTLRNASSLAAEGRSTPHSLLELGFHQTFVDADNNCWMLVPASRWKVDWTGARPNQKKKQYKERSFSPLAPSTVNACVKLVQATSPDQVRSILDSLGLYESTTGHFQWQKAAKLFDDWNLVVQGPICEQYWQLHGAPLCPEADRNPHAFCLCFNCGVAARWGPCEHAYSLMLHQNTIDVVQLPRPRPKGRPKTRSQHCPPGGTLTPGPAVSRASPATPLSADVLQSQALSASESVLRELLRRAGCGHYFPAMKRHGATVQALSSFGFADFVTIFGMKVSEAHILMSTLKDEAGSICAKELWSCHHVLLTDISIYFQDFA